MGRKTPAQKARRNAAKRRKKVLKTLNSNPTPGPDSNKKENQEGLSRPQKLRRYDDKDPILFGSCSPDAPSDSDAGREEGFPDVQSLLDPYSKDQLIGLLCDAALADSDLHARIRAASNRDVSHRKVFVHGLPWDATKEKLIEAFSTYGAIEECNVVVDKATGRCKGYAFVMFQSRFGAVKALRQPHKQIGARVAHCQLASVGPTAALGGVAGHHADTAGRKIYISNVHAEANSEKLRTFFAKFGEIEMGPSGFDLVTGKSKGYAIFVYKTQEGARKALEEPHKMFEGHQLHCQWATDPAKVKGLSSTVAGIVPTAAGLIGSAPQPVLAAVAASPNLSLYSQNPAYAALLGRNPLLSATAGVNPASLPLNMPILDYSALSPSAAGGLAGYGGSSSLLGAYGAQRTAGLQGMQFGRSSVGRPGGSYEGMSSYL